MVATVKGAKELQAKLDEMRRKLADATAAAVYQKFLQIMAVSDQRVPVDTGRLRASHYVELPETNGGTIVVRGGYGTSYALPVHERLGVHHPHGQAKFLSSAFDEHKAGLAEWVYRKAKENLEKGVTLNGGAMPTQPSGGDK